MTYVIAEIGVNHNNNINISKKIIDFCVKKKLMRLNFKLLKLKTCTEKYPKGKIRN